MRLVTTAFVIAAAVAVAALPNAAAAAGLTIGANVGAAKAQNDEFNDNSNETAFKMDIGTSYKEVIGGQIGYVNFGSNADAWTPALTLGVPMGNARLYGKGGIAFAERDHTSVRQDFDNSNRDPFYGVGLSIGMTRGLGFRAEYERYSLPGEDMDLAQAGLELRF